MQEAKDATRCAAAADLEGHVLLLVKMSDPGLKYQCGAFTKRWSSNHTRFFVSQKGGWATPDTVCELLL